MEKTIGIWGQRHLRYLKTHCKIRYTNLFTGGKLNSYLADINEHDEDMFLGLVKQMAECEGVTEQLKVDNQMRNRKPRYNLYLIEVRRQEDFILSAAFAAFGYGKIALP